MKLFQRDITTISLILSNLIAIFLAVNQNWNLLTLLLIYWFQSLIIGFFHFFKMLGVEDYSIKTINLTSGRPEDSPPVHNVFNVGKYFFSFFFALHYGGFHLIYGFFLLSMGNFFGVGPADPVSLALVPIAAGIFFVNHLISFLFYRKKQAKKPNIVAMMFFPYFRIIPTQMHLVIVLGSQMSNSTTILVLFLLLKTGADVAMHWIEHRNQWH